MPLPPMLVTSTFFFEFMVGFFRSRQTTGTGQRLVSRSSLYPISAPWCIRAHLRSLGCGIWRPRMALKKRKKTTNFWVFLVNLVGKLIQGRGVANTVLEVLWPQVLCISFHTPMINGITHRNHRLDMFFSQKWYDQLYMTLGSKGTQPIVQPWGFLTEFSNTMTMFSDATLKTYEWITNLDVPWNKGMALPKGYLLEKIGRELIEPDESKKSTSSIWIVEANMFLTYLRGSCTCLDTEHNCDWRPWAPLRGGFAMNM